jgi:hypothetical protein
MRAAACVERLGLYAATIIGPNGYFSNALQNKRLQCRKNERRPKGAALEAKPV